jgi:hypothetical protein
MLHKRDVGCPGWDFDNDKFEVSRFAVSFYLTLFTNLAQESSSKGALCAGQLFTYGGRVEGEKSAGGPDTSHTHTHIQARASMRETLGTRGL